MRQPAINQPAIVQSVGCGDMGFSGADFATSLIIDVVSSEEERLLSGDLGSMNKN